MDPRDAEPFPGVLLLGLHVRLQPRAGVPAHGARLPDVHAGRGILRAHLQDQDNEVSTACFCIHFTFGSYKDLQLQRLGIKSGAQKCYDQMINEPICA